MFSQEKAEWGRLVWILEDVGALDSQSWALLAAVAERSDNILLVIASLPVELYLSPFHASCAKRIKRQGKPRVKIMKVREALYRGGREVLVVVFMTASSCT